MDKLVWTLLVTVVLSQVLQIAGLVEPPKRIELGEIKYEQGNEYSYRMSIGEDGESRGKRQAGDRSPLIDSLFNQRIEGDLVMRLKLAKTITAKI